MTSPLYTAPTFTDGNPYPAATWQELANEVERLSSIAVTAFTDYTPVWASTGTQPTPGNAILTGQYRNLAPDMVLCQGRVQFGSTSSPGTGVWLFSVATDFHDSAYEIANGTCWMDNVGVSSYPGVCVPYAGSGDKIVLTVPGGGFAGPTSPFTWATGDNVRWSILYRPL